MVLYLYLWDIDLTKTIRALSIALGIIVTADVIRLNSPPFEKFYESVLGPLMRESEKVSQSLHSARSKAFRLMCSILSDKGQWCRLVSYWRHHLPESISC
jgi:hypothetical protein